MQSGRISGAEGQLSESKRFPRSSRLKRRPLIRALFRRGDPAIARVRTGPITVSARLVEAAQLPSGTRVQMGVATRRDLRGVSRVRRRRQLREAFRVQALSELTSQMDASVPPEFGVTVLVLDTGSGRHPSGSLLAHGLSGTIVDLVRRLAAQISPESGSPQTN